MTHAIPASEIRLQVERIADHPSFQQSPLQRTLLRYLANDAIANGFRRVPPWQLQADVIDRQPGGSGREPVPTWKEALGELRGNLDAYVREAGQGDVLRVTIPLGECRLDVTRLPRPAAIPSAAAVVQGDRQAERILVIEFDAEESVTSLPGPLAAAICTRITGLSRPVAGPFSRQALLDKGMAIDHAPAALQAGLGLHGRLVSLPLGIAADTTVGTSVRLFASNGAVLATAWCEAHRMSHDSDVTDLLAEQIARFVAESLPPA